MNDDYGKTQGVKQLIEAAAQLPTSMTPFSPPYPTGASREFLEKDRRRMDDARQTRNARAGDPEQYRRDNFGLRSVPEEPSLLKKEADLTPISCSAPTQQLTGVNDTPRMAQISARSLLIASVTLIPTQPTETQWSAIKEAILAAQLDEN